MRRIPGGALTVRVSRRYEFPASHRLHAPQLSDEQNRATYGKCNNPHGHGHNYQVEITVRAEVDSVTGRAVSLETLDQAAEQEILAPLRYRNLNAEIRTFRESVPTTENLASYLKERLLTNWGNYFGENGPQLERISIWETPRNICEVVLLT